MVLKCTGVVVQFTGEGADVVVQCTGIVVQCNEVCWSSDIKCRCTGVVIQCAEIGVLVVQCAEVRVQCTRVVVAVYRSILELSIGTVCRNVQ